MERKSRDPVPLEEAARKDFVESEALFMKVEVGGSGGDVGL